MFKRKKAWMGEIKLKKASIFSNFRTVFAWHKNVLHSETVDNSRAFKHEGKFDYCCTLRLLYEELSADTYNQTNKFVDLKFWPPVASFLMSRTWSNHRLLIYWFGRWKKQDAECVLLFVAHNTCAWIH